MRVGIVGTGSWGTAVGAAVASTGRPVHMLGREEDTAKAISFLHKNPRYFGDQLLPPSLKATTNSHLFFSSIDLAVICIPAQTLRPALQEWAPILLQELPLILGAKGLELPHAKLLSTTVREVLPYNPIGALSGPGFAKELVRGLPTALALGAPTDEEGKQWQEALSTPPFRLYRTRDVQGVLLGGAFKNVLAIGAGIVMGAGLGENARAALVTRGLSEMTRCAPYFGASPETLKGLSGIGDLVLTAMSTTSRNTSLGFLIGERGKINENIRESIGLVEGMATCQALQTWSSSAQVELPLCHAIYQILFEGAPLGAVLKTLLERPFKSEADFLS